MYKASWSIVPLVAFAVPVPAFAACEPLSCRHVTEGVKRLLAMHRVVHAG